MGVNLPAPVLTHPSQLDAAMRDRGYAVLAPHDVARLAGCTVDELMALRARWNELEPDRYLKDGGHYRKRRHSSFIVEGEHGIAAIAHGGVELGRMREDGSEQVHGPKLTPVRPAA